MMSEVDHLAVFRSHLAQNMFTRCYLGVMHFHLYIPWNRLNTIQNAPF